MALTSHSHGAERAIASVFCRPVADVSKVETILQATFMVLKKGCSGVTSNP